MLSRDDISGNLFFLFLFFFFRSFYTQVWWKSTKWVAQHFQRESNSLMNSEGGGGGGLFFVKQPKPERCHITGAGCSCVKCTQSSRLVEYVAQQKSKRKPHVWWRSPSFFLTSLYTNTPLRLFIPAYWHSKPGAFEILLSFFLFVFWYRDVGVDPCLKPSHAISNGSNFYNHRLRYSSRFCSWSLFVWIKLKTARDF